MNKPEDSDQIPSATKMIFDEIWAVFERYAMEADIKYVQLIGILEVIKAELVQGVLAEDNENVIG